MGEAKESSRTMKVVDRRKFTANGEPIADDAREDGQDVKAAPDAAPEAPTEVGTAGKNGVPAEDRRPTESPSPGTLRDAPARETSEPLLGLIAGLAHQAALMLVGSEETPANPDEARRMIDVLAALEAKTEGNLSAEESKALTDVLFHLRTLFVQSSG